MSKFVHALGTVLVLSCLAQQVHSISVSLSVEGRGSQLVGAHCPGVVRLICEGVDLTFLQWYYNDSIPIGGRPLAFLPNNAINTTHQVTDSPAFNSIKLIDVDQNENITIESALTLNLTALEAQGIHRIGCGDDQTITYINVTISIRDDRTPKVFNFSVTKNHINLTVTWEQNTTGLCPQYLKQVLYEVSIQYGGQNSINKTVHSSDCVPACSVSFNRSRDSELTAGVPENYTVTLYGVTNSNTTLLRVGKGMWLPNPDDVYEDSNCSNEKKMCNGMNRPIGHIACNSTSQLNIDTNCTKELSPPSTTSSITIHIVGSVIGSLLAILILMAIIFLFAYWRRCTAKSRIVEFSPEEINEDYNELRHAGPKHLNEQADPPQSNDAIYDRIGITKGIQYVAVLPESCEDHSFVNDSHSVKYSTVDIEATEKILEWMPKLEEIKSECIEADKLLDLDQCLVQLMSVQDKWKDIGLALSVPITHIEQVEDYCKNNASVGMTEMIDFWMRNCSGHPTWRELANALKAIGSEQLSKELLKVYETGRLPVERDFNEAPVTLKSSLPPPPLPPRSDNNVCVYSDISVTTEAPEIPPRIPSESQ